MTTVKSVTMFTAMAIAALARGTTAAVGPMSTRGCALIVYDEHGRYRVSAEDPYISVESSFPGRLPASLPSRQPVQPDPSIEPWYAVVDTLKAKAVMNPATSLTYKIERVHDSLVLRRSCGGEYISQLPVRIGPLPYGRIPGPLPIYDDVPVGFWSSLERLCESVRDPMTKSQIPNPSPERAGIYCGPTKPYSRTTPRLLRIEVDGPPFPVELAIPAAGASALLRWRRLVTRLKGRSANFRVGRFPGQESRENYLFCTGTVEEQHSIALSGFHVSAEHGASLLVNQVGPPTASGLAAWHFFQNMLRPLPAKGVVQFSFEHGAIHINSNSPSEVSSKLTFGLHAGPPLIPDPPIRIRVRMEDFQAAVKSVRIPDISYIQVAAHVSATTPRHRLILTAKAISGVNQAPNEVRAFVPCKF